MYKKLIYVQLVIYNFIEVELKYETVHVCKVPNFDHF